MPFATYMAAAYATFSEIKYWKRHYTFKSFTNFKPVTVWSLISPLQPYLFLAGLESPGFHWRAQKQERQSQPVLLTGL